jgi:hypothetical protein
MAARERIADWSIPRAGGELKSEPTTENRNRAHWAPVELGVRWIITPPQDGVKGLWQSVFTGQEAWAKSIFCGSVGIIAGT